MTAAHLLPPLTELPPDAPFVHVETRELSPEELDEVMHLVHRLNPRRDDPFDELITAGTRLATATIAAAVVAFLIGIFMLGIKIGWLQRDTDPLASFAAGGAFVGSAWALWAGVRG